MKTVIIGSTRWVDRFPQRTRGDLMRMVFSLASRNGYEIMVYGQRWRATPATARPATRTTAPDMTPERWAALMNAKPS